MNNECAVIVLHEIYGVNAFIKSVCDKLEGAGFDAFSPNLLGTPPLDYARADEAYRRFTENVGFDAYRSVSLEAARLKKSYRKVFILGFSVGATLAWRCAGEGQCDGVIGCYGSRIRDYTGVEPLCPTLLIFAERDSFDVRHLIGSLSGRPYLEMHCFAAAHGFMDSFSKSYDEPSAVHAEALISDFLSAHENQE